MDTRVQFPEKLGGLFDHYTYKVLYGGRGGAKSWSIARALLLMGSQRPLRILCCREVQKSIRDSVYRLLCDQIESLGLTTAYEITQGEIRGPGGTLFIFHGLSDQTNESIKSFEGVDIAWIEEGQAISARSLEILIPTIRKAGSEIWISFNPHLDTDPVWLQFVQSPRDDSLVIPVSWRDNPFLSAKSIADKNHMLQTDPIGYKNVWEGVPRTVAEGAIYEDEMMQMVRERRIARVPYDPLLRVHTVWDLGYNDAMAIIFVQRAGSALNIIEYLEGNRRTYAQWVAEFAERRYLWGTDWLPHDGAAKNAQTGKSAIEILQTLGRAAQMIPISPIDVGINAARMMFPRVAIDAEKASGLIECLKRYRRKIIKATMEPGAPLHDAYSHGADAFRGLAMVADRLQNTDSISAPIVRKERVWV